MAAKMGGVSRPEGQVLGLHIGVDEASRPDQTLGRLDQDQHSRTLPIKKLQYLAPTQQRENKRDIPCNQVQNQIQSTLRQAVRQGVRREVAENHPKVAALPWNVHRKRREPEIIKNDLSNPLENQVHL